MSSIAPILKFVSIHRNLSFMHVILSQLDLFFWTVCYVWISGFKMKKFGGCTSWNCWLVIGGSVIKSGYVSCIVFLILRIVYCIVWCVNDSKYKLKRIVIPCIHAKSISHTKRSFEATKFQVSNHVTLFNKTSIKHLQSQFPPKIPNLHTS